MLFVVFEGIDGAGLSTHSHLLYEYLLGRGYSVVLTKEPTDRLRRRTSRKHLSIASVARTIFRCAGDIA